MKICNDECASYPCSLVQPTGCQCAYERLFEGEIVVDWSCFNDFDSVDTEEYENEK